jgi:uncharacterized membrane protein
VSSEPAATPPEPSAAATSTGLDPKLSGLLAYLGIIGVVIFFIEKTHAEVRFHAAQNTVLVIASIGLWIALSVISVALPFLWLLMLPLSLALFVLWIYLLIQGYNLNHVKLPIVGDLAEKWAAG